MRIENLNSNLATLQFLDLSNNKIPKLSNLDSLVNLQTLKANDNPISRVEDIHGLRSLPALTHLTFQNIDGTDSCPLCKLDGYRTSVYELVPTLLSLDSQRKHLPDLTIEDAANTDIPVDLPSWNLDLESMDDILNPALVSNKLNPLVEEFTRKLEHCRRRLDEGADLLKSLELPA